MKRRVPWLMVLCITAIAGVFLLQFFWIRNYYYVNQATFEKEVNLAFDDAVRKEFSVRCDTVEQLIVKKLLDTNEFSITGRINKKYNRYQYIVANKHNLKNRSEFSHDSLSGPADEVKLRVAQTFAQTLRDEDLENHYVYYRTQNLGEYMTQVTHQYDFDTARLRPILTAYLKRRKIFVPFVLSLRNADSAMNKSSFGSKLLAAYPVITRALPTYKLKANEHYVRAMFTNPVGYIISKMGLMFAASLILIVVVAFSLFYLLRSLLTEKKLAIIKNDFISNITHELKTPIATVSAAVESLSDFNVLDDKEKTQRYLTHSKNELQRLSGLVNTILTSTLYENPAFECTYEQFDIDDTIGKIVSPYQFSSSKPVHIQFQNNSGIASLNADKMLFNQSLENILDNAVKHSGDDVKININCVLDNGFFVIRIKDNGAGIATENLPFLFEKFYRVPTNAHKIKGHGLGLNFVKSIMERHQGWCKAESIAGGGTTLILGWPI